MGLPEYFEFRMRTRVLFERGALEQAGEQAAMLGGARALVATGSSARANGHLDRLCKSLEDAGVAVAAVFDEIPVDSSVETVNRGRDLGLEHGVDMVVAIGGGSIMDTAKAVNILLTEGGDLLEDHQGAYLLERPLKPMIAIPTTAGSASEVTFASVIKDRSEKIKIGFLSPYLAPDVALLDPEVTLSMPPQLTASTGMDALAHAVESLQSAQSEPVADALALGAVRMIAGYLPRAVENGDDIDVRGNMLVASNMAGMAVTNALLGITHGIAHSAGAAADVPHGIANSILLPWGMEFNLDCCEKAFAQAAVALGEKPGTDTRETAQRGIEAVRRLAEKIGLPTRLREVGVSHDHFPAICDLALGDGSLVTNPRPVEHEDDIIAILEKAF